MTLPSQPSTEKIPLWVFQDKSYIVQESTRHNAKTDETTLAASGGVKQFGVYTGQFSSGGAKYNRASVGFEVDNFEIVSPTFARSNLLEFITGGGSNDFGVSVSDYGAGGISDTFCNGVKTTGSTKYLIGNTVNNLPSAGLHRPGWGGETTDNMIEFDLGSVKFAGQLNIFFKVGEDGTDAAGSFVYFKVKTSTDGINYDYVVGREANPANNDYGWAKSTGFPTPDLIVDGAILPTKVRINNDVRFIRIYTDGNHDGVTTDKDAGTTAIERTAEVYEIELDNVDGRRFSGRNHLCVKKTDGVGRQNLTDAELANVDIQFKDLGDSAYIKITNNNPFEIYIYSLELYGLWVLKASEVDSLNGTIRVTVIDEDSNYEPNTLRINNDLFQFAEYAEEVAQSLLESYKDETLKFTINNMPLDLNLRNMQVIKLDNPDISTSEVKTLIRKKTYRLSSTESSIALTLQEDKNIVA